MVEHWNSDGRTVWWNSDGKTAWWNGGTVVVEQWNSGTVLVAFPRTLLANKEIGMICVRSLVH